MGSLGIGEILIIVFIGFLIFGPEKLPEILKNIHKTFKKIFDIKDDLQNSLYDIKDEIENSVKIDNFKIDDNNNKKNTRKKKSKKINNSK